jgi:predicted aminopeptidase
MRDFAVSELKLPDNASYRRYADLHAAAAVWNVVAAPELSLQLQDLVLPGGGLRRLPRLLRPARRRGLRRELRAEARGQRATACRPIRRSAAAGDCFADPLLNTFIQLPEGELARLIFHELAHQVAYAQRRHRCSTSRSRPRSSASAAALAAQHASAAAREEYERSTRAGRTFAR